MSKKTTIAFAGIVLAGSLGFAAVASAAEGDSAVGNRPQLTTEQRCAKADEITARAGEIQGKIAERTAALQAKRAEAEAAGDEQKVERIDARLARLEKASTRISDRLARLEIWVGEHCDV